MLITLIFQGCERTGSKLSDTAKSVFFTDQRPFDRELINEDIKRLNDAISLTPRDGRLLVARGFIYAALNDFDKAIADFERAAEIDSSMDIADPYGPGKKGVHYLLGLAYWQSGKPGKAVSHFSKVIEGDPKHSRSYYYRGMANLALNDKSAAIKDIEQASNLGSEPFYLQTLQELRGSQLEERLFGTYIVCFHPNKPPQSRPFGYVWEIRCEVR